MASVREGDKRWELAQKAFDDGAHYEPVSVPDWQAYRTAAAEALNKLISECGDSQKALDGLNDKFTELLDARGSAG